MMTRAASLSQPSLLLFNNGAPIGGRGRDGASGGRAAADDLALLPQVGSNDDAAHKEAPS